MNVILITGASGLVGSESVTFFAKHFDKIIGVDNDLRAQFFGQDASTLKKKHQHLNLYPHYHHYDQDIRDEEGIEKIFLEFGADISLIIHAAAQPSHDWAAKDPKLDFSVNATATLQLLELTRRYCPHAVFIFTSTNKVYGNRPNQLPLLEMDSRWELPMTDPNFNGISEKMSIDHTLHSIFGASKVAADIMVQEYGQYFGMKTGVFRGGCITGPDHMGAQLHGFLAYLMKCVIEKEPYTIFGYKGKQVRDNIHSWDLVNMFWHFYQNPKPGSVYNAGGGRFANCSLLEAVALAKKITGNSLAYTYLNQNRKGDHKWWISDLSRFKTDYPGWEPRFSLEDTMYQIFKKLK